MKRLLWGLKRPTWASFSMNLPHNYNVITRPWLACQWLWLWWQIWCRLQNAPADGLSESYNWVNELHALICYSFIWATWGMTTISLLHGLLYVWWVPWRVFLDSAARTSRRKTVLICEAEKKDFILSMPFFPPSCSLILRWIFKYYCNLFITAQCSASRSYFRWMSSRRGVGSCLTQRQRAAACLGEHLFVAVLRVLWHFQVPPLKGIESGLAWFYKPPPCNAKGFERAKGGRKCHLRHRVSCQRIDVHILTFLCTVVCSILMDQTWKPRRPDLTSHPSVQSVKEDQTVSITVQSHGI